MKISIPPVKHEKFHISYAQHSPPILFFDVESIGVNAFYGDTGIMLMCAYKWAGEKQTHILTMTREEFSTLDDTRIVKEISDLLVRSAIRVAHYGQYFDIKFINTRRLMLGLDPLPSHILQVDDTIKTLWKDHKFHKNRLGHIARVLHLTEEKGESNFPLPWMQIIRFRDDKAWKVYGKMAQYCKQDVRTLEQAYYKLHPEYRRYNGR